MLQWGRGTLDGLLQINTQKMVTSFLSTNGNRKCNGKKDYFYERERKKKRRKERKGRKKRKGSLLLDILMKIMYWGLYRYSNKSFIGSV